MYRILLVDDEILVRDAIKENIDWKGMDCELVGDCENGKEAAEFVKEHPVDIVLTDILMPYMDGMELSHFLHDNYPEIVIVIFSGFGEFEYAKQAIQYGVSEYLLKPILKEEFEEILEKMLERHFAEEIKKQEKTGDIVQEVETYIREHVEEDLSLELLAGVVHLNPSYLSRYFKDSTGENLSNFVTRCKMEKAAWLLEHTEQKINEIMQRLGYQKSQHFAKIFREQYGVSPKDYKRGIRS